MPFKTIMDSPFIPIIAGITVGILTFLFKIEFEDDSTKHDETNNTQTKQTKRQTDEVNVLQTLLIRTQGNQLEDLTRRIAVYELELMQLKAIIFKDGLNG